MKRSIFPKYGIILVLIIGTLLTVVCLLLPSQPNGRRQESGFVVDAFVSGTQLQLCSDVYTLVAPEPEYLWTDLSEVELINQLAVDNENLEIQFVGATLSGHNHYLMSIYNHDRKTNDYYAMISYGSELVDGKDLNRYTLTSLSTSFYDDSEILVERKILFPTILIDDDELPFFSLRAGEKYPMISSKNTFFASSADVLAYICDFYSQSQWYSVNTLESEKLIVSLVDDMDSSIIDEFILYENAFEITISEAASGYEIAIEKGGGGEPLADG